MPIFYKSLSSNPKVWLTFRFLLIIFHHLIVAQLKKRCAVYEKFKGKKEQLKIKIKSITFLSFLTISTQKRLQDTQKTKLFQR